MVNVRCCQTIDSRDHLRPSSAELRREARQRRRFIRLRRKLEEVFRAEGYSGRKASDLAFHMLDWLEDREDLWTLYRNLGRRDHEQILDCIIGFLVHAPHHLDAAKYLAGLGPPEDVFKLGFFRVRGRRRKKSKK
jgi:hypothetical protein